MYVCVCVSVAPFTLFLNSFRGGAQEHSLGVVVIVNALHSIS